MNLLLDKLRYIKVFSFVNDEGSELEKEFRFKFKDWIEFSFEMEFGIDSEKLLLVIERFCRVVRLLIFNGNEEENKLFDIFRYCSLLKEFILLGILLFMELLVIESFINMVRFVKIFKFVLVERFKLLRIILVICLVL